MRVALYARVSTRDKEQDPDVQLAVLRKHCELMAWTIAGEYVDKASANDLRGRVQWRHLHDDAVNSNFDAVFVFKLDRAFRSVKHMHDTLEIWQLADVDFVSARDSFDTTSASGRLFLTMLAAFAEFELEQLRERVVAGMDNVRTLEDGVIRTRSGKPIGRPAIASYRHCAECRRYFPDSHFAGSRHHAGDTAQQAIAPYVDAYRAGKASQAEISRRLKISRRSVAKLLAPDNDPDGIALAAAA